MLFDANPKPMAAPKVPTVATPAMRVGAVTEKPGLSSSSAAVGWPASGWSSSSFSPGLSSMRNSSVVFWFGSTFTSRVTPRNFGFSITAPTIVAGVATVATFGTAIGFGFTSKSTSDNLMRGFDMTANTYQGTRQQALDAQRNALISNVFYGISAAALVVTVVLVVLDAKRPSDDGDTEVEVTPAAAPGGGGLIIGGRF